MQSAKLVSALQPTPKFVLYRLALMGMYITVETAQLDHLQT
jgi:hypothetical protein